MDFKHIDYILEIAKTCNFNRAAENLFISQPSLTYQIRVIEEELGFQLFYRSVKGAMLTPEGKQFCVTLRNIRDEFKFAVEQCQNFGSRYKSNISIGLPMRSAIYFLPQAIEQFEKSHSEISVTPRFIPLGTFDKFLAGEQDIVFAREEDMKHIPNIKIHKLFQSKIYLITENVDPLAKKEKIFIEDLKGRTLMVGGGSQPELRAVQQRVIQNLNLPHFNSNDYETTLTNIAAHKGICLAPGFLNDRNKEFSWIPFDCDEKISCVLCTHANKKINDVEDFVRILQKFYVDNPNFPV